MSVILLILKIIGWILLTLPALFLLIVFLVLVVPVRYRTDGSIEENIRVQGKVHWLLHILSFGFSYNEEGFSYTLKLFGKRIALGEKLEDEEEEPDADSTDTAVHETKAEVENILPSDSKMQRRDVSVKDAAEANEKKDSKDGTDTKEQTSIVRKNIDETDSEKVSFGQRIPSACPVADGSHSAKFSSVSIFRKRECFSKYLSSFQIAETLLRLCSSVSAAFIFPACPDRSASFPRIPLILLVIS